MALEIRSEDFGESNLRSIFAEQPRPIQIIRGSLAMETSHHLKKNGAYAKSQTSSKQTFISMKIKYFFLLIGVVALFSSCAIHRGLTSNVNQNATEVVLSRKNFRVVETVQGQSSAVFVFGIGGLSRNAMVAEARAHMLSKANIVGTSRAIINESVEVKHSILPIVRRYTVTVSAHIIEFTE